MADFIRDKDGKEVTISGTFSRHGIAIVTIAILGAAVGTAIGYAVSAHTGMSKAWCMSIGGFSGFVIVGGITYAVFDSIDQAELAAERFAEKHLAEAGYKIKTGNNEENASELAGQMQTLLNKFNGAKQEPAAAA